MAAQRRARQSHGARAGGRSPDDSAGTGGVEGRGQWRVRADSAVGDREDQGALLFLSLDRRGEYRALDVLVRYDRRGRQGLCRCGGGSSEGLTKGGPGRIVGWFESSVQMASSRAKPPFRRSEGSRAECPVSARKILGPPVRTRAFGMTPEKSEQMA